MEYTKIKKINEYISKSINPMKTPNTIFEVYSVPSFSTEHPEYLRGDEIASNKAVVKKNDVLLCKINPRINRVWVVADESEYQNIASSEWIIIRNSDYNPEFLAWYFRNPKFKNLMISGVTGMGGSLMRAQPKNVAEYPVPILKREKQDEIVSILNKVARVIEFRKKEIQKLDKLIKARFVEMFGTLHDNRNGFAVVTIEDVCSLVKDGTHQTPQYTENKEEGYKFLSSKDVMSQKIDWTDIKYIPAELHEKLYATIKPQRNDILMSKNGVNYGVAAVNDTDEVFDIYVSLALLRPKQIINPIFFRCIINNPETKRQFDSSIKGIGVPNLHLGEIKKTKIILPPLELQNKFVEFVNQVDKSKVAVQKALDEAQLLFDSLMQEYFG